MLNIGKLRKARLKARVKPPNITQLAVNVTWTRVCYDSIYWLCYVVVVFF